MKRFDSSGQPMPEVLEEEKRLQELFPRYRGVDADYAHAGEAALERFWDWKFGIRIHWGIYSITGCGPESWTLSNANGEFREQYEQLYKWWNPCRFDADEWCDLFSRVGLKYFTFTTKHHDGFSLYDTKTKVKRRLAHTGSDAGKIVDCDLHYSIMETPFKRDIVRELVEAGRKRELGIGLYFSHIDWFDADFRIDRWNYQKDEKYAKESDPEGFARMIARHREQIRELCTNYGKIDLLSFDMGFPGGEEINEHGIGTKHGIRDELVKTVKMARRLQPEMLMRERGITPYGDYRTPERVVPGNTDALVRGQKMPWKVIYPGSKHFSHNWHDEYHPSSWIIKNLVDITAKGGSFQIGYGPMPDGTWAPGIVRRLEEVGKWLKVNGEAIYCTRPYNVFAEGANVRFTQSKDKKYVYAIILGWSEAPFTGGSIRLTSVRTKRGSAIKMLGLDHCFEYTQDDDALSIQLPLWLNDDNKRPCDVAYTFKIEVA